MTDHTIVERPTVFQIFCFYGVIFALALGVSFFTNRLNSVVHAVNAVASDAFTRSVSSGWGTADLGGAYSLKGTANGFAVNGASGTMTPVAGGSTGQLIARLTSVSADNIDETVRFTMDKVPSGSNGFVYLLARSNGSNTEYRGRITITPAGAISLQALKLVAGVESSLGTAATQPGVTFSAGSYLDAHMELNGSNPTTILMRVWPDGTTEPITWTYSVTDSDAALQTTGGVGLISRAATNVPVVYSYDDFTVVIPSTVTPTPTPVPVVPTVTPTGIIVPTNTSTPSPTPSATDPVIAVAGDIACGAGSTGAACKQLQTANLISTINPIAVLNLGDNQYEQGSLSDFQNFYDPSWGAFKTKTYPSVGNHEYLTTGAQGYFDYFNGVGNLTGSAGDRSKGYYSYDIGNWHLMALNTNCSKAGGCGTGSPQNTWLKNELAANSTKCLLAYSHHPMFSSGQQPHNAGVDPLYSLLYAAHADVFLVAHDHDYERFVPSNTTGGLDTQFGVTEFVVGSGGRNHTHLSSSGLLPNSVVFDDTSFGVLKMTLHPTSFDWTFLPIAGSTFTDSGTAACHIATI